MAATQVHAAQRVSALLKSKDFADFQRISSEKQGIDFSYVERICDSSNIQLLSHSQVTRLLKSGKHLSKICIGELNQQLNKLKYAGY